MRRIYLSVLLFLFLMVAASAVSAQVTVGDIISFGTYEQDNDLSNGPEPIEWQVLAVEDGRALVISRFALDSKPYDENLFPEVTWEVCWLRGWLNGEFLASAFSADEQAQIALVTVVNPDNPKNGNPGGNPTEDQFFLLSFDEAEAYFADDEARMNEATEYAKANGGYVSENGASSWWLRSSGPNHLTAMHVITNGSIAYEGDMKNAAGHVIRPAFWMIF